MFLIEIFSLLDPDPHIECGSGSTALPATTVFFINNLAGNEKNGDLSNPHTGIWYLTSSSEGNPGLHLWKHLYGCFITNLLPKPNYGRQTFLWTVFVQVGRLSYLVELCVWQPMEYRAALLAVAPAGVLVGVQELPERRVLHYHQGLRLLVLIHTVRGHRT